MSEEELIKALKEMDKKRVEELDKNTKKVFDTVMKIADDKDKYKSLYENEKEHIDTLKRIIKKIEEYIEKNTEFKESTFYGLPDYYIFKGNIENVINLLKEIK